jgi:hypothetical protein
MLRVLLIRSAIPAINLNLVYSRVYHRWAGVKFEQPFTQTAHLYKD